MTIAPIKIRQRMLTSLQPILLTKKTFPPPLSPPRRPRQWRAVRSPPRIALRVGDPQQFHCLRKYLAFGLNATHGVHVGCVFKPALLIGSARRSRPRPAARPPPRRDPHSQ